MKDALPNGGQLELGMNRFYWYWERHVAVVLARTVGSDRDQSSP